MSIRRTKRTSRVMTAVSTAAVFALVLSGCGTDEDGKAQEGDTPPSASTSESQPAESTPAAQEDTAAGENVDPNANLAVAQGQSGVILTVTQVKRDTGGFVTVQAVIENKGKTSVNPSSWVGGEPGVVDANFNSVAGATLVDKVGKKRYYVLRDTDNRCLCTTKIKSLPPGDSTSVFMQFPAPPNTTTEVDFTLPTFATASLKISG